MDGILTHLWLIPGLPLVAAGVTALLRRPYRRLAAGLAIGSLAAAFVLAVLAFVRTLGSSGHGAVLRETVAFDWFSLGPGALRLGWVLDPLSASMLVMVSGVGLLIFIYSTGYMAHDDNFTRFFGFLALFAAAMLGLVMANSLLLMFVCWELVGLASYLLIGFWYQRPAAAAAARKAFITTRVGDLGFFLGLLWLYRETGTLLCYDGGNGCLEPTALKGLTAPTLLAGLTVSTAIGLLLFCGAMGKSGQLPLHVWLPDAMEGPTPVSALIHAATMVAAGVFLMARVYPLLAAAPGLPSAATAGVPTPTLHVVTWVGAATAVVAALIAVAQTDLKRILAYSTVSQLGFMMLGLGVGGPAVALFHLLTHACFKALLFLGAGSVIHGVHGEQDIRRLGGLAHLLPLTFGTYAVGMMALAGVPLLFSGFWSKDAILHAAHAWKATRIPFFLGLLGALLTAFYMTRQVLLVFFGPRRTAPTDAGRAAQPHESPPMMTVPLVLLAVVAVLLGFWGTPAWPWLQAYLNGTEAEFKPGELLAWEQLSLILSSALIVFGGVTLGWWFYGRRPLRRAADLDPLELKYPVVFGWLRQRLFFDELYAVTVIRAHAAWATLCDRMDRWVWDGVVRGLTLLAALFSWAARLVDEFVVNRGFDLSCRALRRGGRWTAGLQDGQLQNYLRALALALGLLLLFLIWGGRA